MTSRERSARGPRIREHDGVMEIGSKVSMLGTSLPVFLYWVDGLLIDTGAYRMRREMLPFLRSQPLERVALTHTHEDHSGLAPYLQREKGLVPTVPEESVKQVERRAKLPLYRRLFWGPRKAFRASAHPEVIRTRNFCFRVLQSPGHTREHVCFLEESKGWLFSGDLFVRSRPGLFFAQEYVADMIRTLQSLAQVNFEYLFCGHAGMVAEGRQALRQKLDYLLEMKEAVQHYRQLGYSPEQTDRILFPHKPLMNRISMGEWSSLNMVHGLYKMTEDRGREEQ